jgi:hypothetical protein
MMPSKKIPAAAVVIAAMLALCAPAAAEVPEVQIARQFSMGYLQFNVIEHEKLIQKHAATLGIPEVKVSGVRFNGRILTVMAGLVPAICARTAGGGWPERVRP